jgi:hypothetical protein
MKLHLVTPEQRTGFGNFPVPRTLARYRVRCRMHRAAVAAVNEQLALEDVPVDLLALYGE